MVPESALIQKDGTHVIVMMAQDPGSSLLPYSN